MKAASVRILLLLMFALCAAWLAAQQAPPPSTGPHEEALPEEAQEQEWTKAFQAAEDMFRSENQSGSIPLFQDLVTKINDWKSTHPLTDPQKLLLLRSLDHMGIAYYNDGQKDPAGQAFLSLIQVNPAYELDAATVSTKIIDYFNQIKAQNLGAVTILSEPKGATIHMDGQSIGTTDLTGYPAQKGDHEIEIAKPGFTAQKQTITVAPQKTLKVNVKLERNSAVGYFLTYPKGVEIIMGGKSLGVSTGDASQRGIDAATQRNLPAADFSGEFAIPDLQTGVYEVEFRKPCWAPTTQRFTVDKYDDIYYEPVILEPSVAYLNITADDDKAGITIDGEYLGTAPKQKLQVCSGTHVLKLSSGRGKFERRMDFKKGETVNIAAKMNPSLAFLGLFSEPDVRRTDLDKLSTDVASKLSDLQNLNFVDNSSMLDANLQQTLAQIMDGINSNKPDKDRNAAIQAICTKADSDLLLVGFVQKEPLLRTVRFYLLSNWSSMADIRTVQTNLPDKMKIFKDELEYEEPLFQKRLGVQLIDTDVTAGPVISQVLLKTFQDSQPLQQGDAITMVNSQAVKTAKDVQQAIAKTQAQDAVTLTVVRSGASLTVPIKMVSSPMEIQFNNPTLMFNRQLIAFRKAIAISTTTLEKNVALLNIGLCHMHFAEYETAYEQLRQVQLTRTVGIGPGTVAYRIAQCYRELGETYVKDAMDSLTEAGKYPQNTLFSDDGPSLVREIQRAQLFLQ